MWVVYIPFGPGPSEPGRLHDLLCSLEWAEPAGVQVVIVNDSGVPMPTALIDSHPALAVTVLTHPRRSSARDALGAVCAADLLACAYVHGAQPTAHVLKVDTDALMIGPWVQRLDNRLRRTRCGLIGTRGDSCNRTHRSFAGEQQAARLLRRLFQIALRFDQLSDDDRRDLADWGFGDSTVLADTFAAVTRLVHVPSRYRGAHCQGGAFAITSDLLTRMAALGAFEDVAVWQRTPIAEDRMMGWFAAACGLPAVDYSRRGEVFGIQAGGLAFSPRELLARGYAIVHSVKSDRRYHEQDVRRYFADLRRAPVN